MIQGDIYLHYKGKEYMFEGIALPATKDESEGYDFIGYVFDANTPDGEEVIKLKLFENENKYYIVGDSRRVLYYSDLEYEVDKFWCRIYEDFYSDVKLKTGLIVERFKKKN